MNQELGSWSSGIPRMVALGERCAAEVQMNLNKLLEAAAYAQARRAAWHSWQDYCDRLMQFVTTAGGPAAVAPADPPVAAAS